MKTVATLNDVLESIEAFSEEEKEVLLEIIEKRLIEDKRERLANRSCCMKIADLSEREFKALLGDVIEEKLREILDPDYGLKLRKDFAKRLEASISSRKRIPLAEVKKKLGMS